MQDPVRVGPFAKKGHINVVIETSAQSRTKFKWDEDAQLYRAGRVLPLGMASVRLRLRARHEGR